MLLERVLTPSERAVRTVLTPPGRAVRAQCANTVLTLERGPWRLLCKTAPVYPQTDPHTAYSSGPVCSTRIQLIPKYADPHTGAAAVPAMYPSTHASAGTVYM